MFTYTLCAFAGLFVVLKFLIFFVFTFKNLYTCTYTYIFNVLFKLSDWDCLQIKPAKEILLASILLHWRRSQYLLCCQFTKTSKDPTLIQRSKRNKDKISKNPWKKLQFKQLQYLRTKILHNRISATFLQSHMYRDQIKISKRSKAKWQREWKNIVYVTRPNGLRYIIYLWINTIFNRQEEKITNKQKIHSRKNIRLFITKSIWFIYLMWG